MRRRGFLAAAGTALTAGCTSALPFGSTPTPTPTPTPTETPTPSPTPTPIPTATPFPFDQATNAQFTPTENPYTVGYARTGGIELARGEYFPLSFERSSAINLRYAFEVIEGEAIDVLVMDMDTFDQYRNRSSVLRLYGDASVGGTSAHQVQVRLPAGTYVLVFDNTSLGLSKPSGSSRLVYGLGFGDSS